MKHGRAVSKLAVLACLVVLGAAWPRPSAADGPWLLRFDDQALEVSSLHDGKSVLRRSIDLGGGTTVAAAWADERTAWILRLDPDSLEHERWLVDLRDGRKLASLPSGAIPVRTAAGWVVFAQDDDRVRAVAAGRAPPFEPITPPTDWHEGFLAAPPALGETVMRWNSSLTVGGTAAVESLTALAVTSNGVLGHDGSTGRLRQVIPGDLRARPLNVRSFADGRHVLLLEQPDSQRVNRHGSFMTFLVGARAGRVAVEPRWNEAHVVAPDLTYTAWPALEQPAVLFAPDHAWVRQGERMVRWRAEPARLSTGTTLPPQLVALPWTSTEPGGSRALLQLVGAMRSSARTYLLDASSGVLTEVPQPKPSRSESGRGRHLGTVRFHFWTTGQVTWQRPRD